MLIPLQDKIWVPHRLKLWEPADVISVSPDGKSVTVAFITDASRKRLDDGEGGEEKKGVRLKENANTSLFVFLLSKTLSYDQDHEDSSWDNLLHMRDINEASLMNVLKQRFDRAQIYTFTGDVLISVNPYECRVPHLYDCAKYYEENIILPRIAEKNKMKKQDTMVRQSISDGDTAKGNKVLQDEKGEKRPRTRVDVEKGPPPHIFSVAQHAYHTMLTSSFKLVSQSVLINGESGAGKTEAAKHMMRYLTFLSQEKRKELTKDSAAKSLVGQFGRGVKASGLGKLFGKIRRGRRKGSYISLGSNSEQDTYPGDDETGERKNPNIMGSSFKSTNSTRTGPRKNSSFRSGKGSISSIKDNGSVHSSSRGKRMDSVASTRSSSSIVRRFFGVASSPSRSSKSRRANHVRKTSTSPRASRNHKTVGSPLPSSPKHSSFRNRKITNTVPDREHEGDDSDSSNMTTEVIESIKTRRGSHLKRIVSGKKSHSKKPFPRHQRSSKALLLDSNRPRSSSVKHIPSTATRNRLSSMASNRTNRTSRTGNDGGGSRRWAAMSDASSTYDDVDSLYDGESPTLPLSHVESVLLQTNVLLEACGNSQTVRNNNSSRFGKFVQLNFNKQGIITGGTVKHFLLETSRVTAHAPGERNYHIFYWLCAYAQQQASHGSRNPYLSWRVNNNSTRSSSNAAAIAITNSRFHHPLSKEGSFSSLTLPTAATSTSPSSSSVVVGLHAWDYFTYLRCREEGSDGGGGTGGSTLNNRQVNTVWGSPKLTTAAGGGHDNNVMLPHVVQQNEAGLFISSGGEDEEAALLRQEHDARHLRSVMQAMDVINISREEQKDVWKAMTAILYLGNIVYETQEGGEEKEGSIQSGEVQVASNTREALECASHLLGFSDSKVLLDTISHRTIRAGSNGSIAQIALSKEQARDSTDGLAKVLYNALFDWLVFKVNMASAMESTPTNNTSSTAASSISTSTTPAYVGLLDVFGFEVFEMNSFEQLCINYCNERLQMIFDAHIYDLELERYAIENIEHGLQIRESTLLLRLLDHKSTGVLQLLDEQVMLTGGSNSSSSSEESEKLMRNAEKIVLNKLHRIHGNHNLNKSKSANKSTLKSSSTNLPNPFYLRSHSSTEFIVKHYAGPVTYRIHGMIRKNSNALQPDLENLVLSFHCENEFVKKVLSRTEQTNYAMKGDKMMMVHQKDTLKTNKSQKMAQFGTVSSQFRTQLYDLEAMLQGTGMHFVRCVKPNETKSPRVWNYEQIFRQLRMLGTLEMISLRREGYAVSMNFSMVLRKYATLLEKTEEEKEAERLQQKEKEEQQKQSKEEKEEEDNKTDDSSTSIHSHRSTEATAQVSDVSKAEGGKDQEQAVVASTGEEEVADNNILIFTNQIAYERNPEKCRAACGYLLSTVLGDVGHGGGGGSSSNRVSRDYGALLDEEEEEEEEKKRALLRRRDWQLGKTKCFLRESALNRLDLMLRRKREEGRTLLQILAQRKLDEQQRALQEKSSTLLSSVVRGYMERVRYMERKKGATKIASQYRAVRIQKRYAYLQSMFIRLQSHSRGFLVRRQQSLLPRFLILQAHFRGRKIRLRFQRLMAQTAPLKHLLLPGEVVVHSSTVLVQAKRSSANTNYARAAGESLSSTITPHRPSRSRSRGSSGGVKINSGKERDAREVVLVFTGGRHHRLFYVVSSDSVGFLGQIPWDPQHLSITLHSNKAFTFQNVYTPEEHQLHARVHARHVLRQERRQQQQQGQQHQQQQGGRPVRVRSTSSASSYSSASSSLHPRPMSLSQARFETLYPAATSSSSNKSVSSSRTASTTRTAATAMRTRKKTSKKQQRNLLRRIFIGGTTHTSSTTNKSNKNDAYNRSSTTHVLANHANKYAATSNRSIRSTSIATTATSDSSESAITAPVALGHNSSDLQSLLRSRSAKLAPPAAETPREKCCEELDTFEYLIRDTSTTSTALLWTLLLQQPYSMQKLMSVNHIAEEFVEILHGTLKTLNTTSSKGKGEDDGRRDSMTSSVSNISVSSSNTTTRKKPSRTRSPNNKRKQWREHTFILRGSTLYWTNNRGGVAGGISLGSDVKFSLPGRHMTVRKYCIDIYTAQQQSVLLPDGNPSPPFRIQASGEEQQETWLMALSMAVSRQSNIIKQYIQEEKQRQVLERRRRKHRLQQQAEGEQEGKSMVMESSSSSSRKTAVVLYTGRDERGLKRRRRRRLSPPSIMA